MSSPIGGAGGGARLAGAVRWRQRQIYGGQGGRGIGQCSAHAAAHQCLLSTGASSRASSPCWVRMRSRYTEGEQAGPEGGLGWKIRRQDSTEAPVAETRRRSAGEDHFESEVNHTESTPAHLLFCKRCFQVWSSQPLSTRPQKHTFHSRALTQEGLRFHTCLWTFQEKREEEHEDEGADSGGRGRRRSGPCGVCSAAAPAVDSHDGCKNTGAYGGEQALTSTRGFSRLQVHIRRSLPQIDVSRFLSWRTLFRLPLRYGKEGKKI